MTNDPRAQSEQSDIESLIEGLHHAAGDQEHRTYANQIRVAFAASRAESATLQAELAMATDAANKGDDARTKAGAMQDRISDLRNIIAGMFWAGGSIDDKTMGDIRALGLDCRAERDALAALVEVARCPNRHCEGGVIPTTDGYGGWQQIQCQWCDERAQALRAGQQNGTVNE